MWYSEGSPVGSTDQMVNHSFNRVSVRCNGINSDVGYWRLRPYTRINTFREYSEKAMNARAVTVFATCHSVRASATLLRDRYHNQQIRALCEEFGITHVDAYNLSFSRVDRCVDGFHYSPRKCRRPCWAYNISRGFPAGRCCFKSDLWTHSVSLTGVWSCCKHFIVQHFKCFRVFRAPRAPIRLILPSACKSFQNRGTPASLSVAHTFRKLISFQLGKALLLPDLFTLYRNLRMLRTARQPEEMNNSE